MKHKKSLKKAVEQLMLGTIKDVDLIAAELEKHSITGNILGLYLKLITRKKLKNWNQFTRKVILNLFARQLKTKLLTRGNVFQFKPD